MRKLGCLIFVALLALGVWLLADTGGMTDEQKGQWVGEKVHRGWQRLQRMLDGAKAGWDKSQDGKAGQPPSP